MAYVTGSHSFKTGFNRTHGFQETTNYNQNNLAFTFNNGVPNTVTMRANPVTFRNHLDNDLGIFAQDKWTMNRTTVNLALRFDHFKASFPEQRVGPAPLAPTRNFVVPGPGQPELERPHLPDRADLRPARQRQDGRQADVQQVPAWTDAERARHRSEPGQHHGHDGDRAWNDLDRDFVPDCDLLDFRGKRANARASPTPLFGVGHAKRHVRRHPPHRLRQPGDQLGVLGRRAARVAAARLAGRRLLPAHLEELPRDRQPVRSRRRTSTPSA